MQIKKGIFLPSRDAPFAHGSSGADTQLAAPIFPSEGGTPLSSVVLAFDAGGSTRPGRPTIPSFHQSNIPELHFGPVCGVFEIFEAYQSRPKPSRWGRLYRRMRDRLSVKVSVMRNPFVSPRSTAN